MCDNTAVFVNCINYRNKNKVHCEDFTIAMNQNLLISKLYKICFSQQKAGKVFTKTIVAMENLWSRSTQKFAITCTSRRY